MQDFINETIDTTQLPKFEAVQFTSLHRNYWTLTLIHLSILFLVLGAALSFVMIYNKPLLPYRFNLSLAAIVLAFFILLFSWIAFKKKAFAFRNHDVLFRSGIIATNTTVIPYNRIQHVALHEGFVSRILGLATIEIFTAGGRSSDIRIPGIQKEQAENIKQLLMGKIQKQL